MARAVSRSRRCAGWQARSSRSARAVAEASGCEQRRRIAGRWPAFTAGVLLACSVNFTAFAQETGEDRWTFTVTPYLWAAGISGEAGTLPGIPPADVDDSFGDIFDDLRFAGMVAASARRGRFGLAGDLQYVETRADSSSLAPLFDGETLTSKSFIFSALGEYVAFENDRTQLLVSGGLRVWSVDTELDLDSGLLPGRTIDGDDTWVDPMLGVRGRIDVVGDVFASGWAYAGGFGAGSEIMADLFGGVGYAWTDRIETTLGYRWLRVDRDTDDFLYDVRQGGLIAGLTVKF